MQRKVLIGVTRSFRIASTDALPVITGIPPILIVVKQKVSLSSVCKGIAVQFGDVNIERDTPMKVVNNKIL